MGESLSLTAAEVERIQGSFDQVWAISSRTAGLFYDRLFASAELVPLLVPSDAEEQKRKFIATLATIVGSLDDRADVRSLAQRLAHQHAEFGIGAKQNALIGDALIWSLEQGLGSRCTPEVAAAWRKAYGMLAQHMSASAYG